MFLNTFLLLLYEMFSILLSANGKAATIVHFGWATYQPDGDYRHIWPLFPSVNHLFEVS